MRLRATAALFALVSLAFAACAKSNNTTSSSGSPAPATKAAITVGSPDFTEGRVLGEIYAQALTAKGYKVTKKLGIGARPVYITALEKGQLDVVPEYTGNLLRYVTKSQNAPATSSATYDALATPLAKVKLAVLQPASAEDKDGVVVTKATADKDSLKKVSDLKPFASKLTFAGPPECTANPACLKGLQSVYGIHFKKFEALQSGTVTVTALKTGAVDAANIFSTSGAIAANNFVVLDDDMHIAGAQNVVPLIRKATLAAGAGIATVLNGVDAKITTAGLTELNKKVDTDKADPSAVARDWLSTNGLM
jgi:osmoprotectant transport system substrate-binding protein